MKAETPDQARILKWLTVAGGEMTRHQLRRKAPRIIQWKPLERALRALIRGGSVLPYRDEYESINRGCGVVTQRYRLKGFEGEE